MTSTDPERVAGNPKPVRTALVLLAILVFYAAFQGPLMEVGIADNCDFLARAAAVTSGPVGCTPDIFSPEAEGFEDRYFIHWLRHWTLDQHWQKPQSSTPLWWHAIASVGGLLGAETLDLAVLGLTLRLVSLGFALLLLVALAGRVGSVAWLFVGLVLVLLHLDWEITCYQASFFEAAGFLPFLFLTLWSLVVALGDQPRIGRSIAALAALFLVGTVQGTTLPLLAVGSLLLCWGTLRQRFAERPWIPVLLGLILALAISAVGFDVVGNRLPEANRYNSLFYGALTFSNDPDPHLDRLGLGEHRDLVGKHAWTPEGRAYIRTRPADEFSFSAPLSVYLREPRTVHRALALIGDTLHVPDAIGHYEPPAKGHQKREGPPSDSRLYVAFTKMSEAVLPGGTLFWLWTSLLTLAHLQVLKKRRPPAPLSVIAAFLLGAGLLSAGLAIFGDGKFDLPRHLIYARVMCGLGTLLSLPMLWTALRATVTALRRRISSRQTRELGSPQRELCK